MFWETHPSCTLVSPLHANLEWRDVETPQPTQVRLAYAPPTDDPLLTSLRDAVLHARRRARQRGARPGQRD